MPRLRHMVIFIVICAIILLLSGSVFAEQSFYYTFEAQALNDMGLYDGISTSYFDPDLGTSVNRETGIMLLLKMFGKQNEVAAISYADADKVLAKFSDKNRISDWAKKYIAYAIENDMVTGDSPTTVSPNKPLDGRSYATMILRNLGYAIDAKGWETALHTLAEKGGLTAKEADLFDKNNLIKDDLVGIAYGSLMAKGSTNTKLIEKLIAENAVVKEKALKAGLLEDSDGKKPQGMGPMAIVATKNGNYAYVNFCGSENVFKINLKTFEIEAATDLSAYFPIASEQMVMDTGEKKLFVYTPTWRKLLVLDTQTMEVIHTIDDIGICRLTQSLNGSDIIACSGGGTVRFINTETYKVTEFEDDNMYFNMIQECKDDQSKWYVVNGQQGGFDAGIYDCKTKAWVNKISHKGEGARDLKVLSNGKKAYIATFGGWYPDYHAYGWLYTIDLTTWEVKTIPIDGGAFHLEENPYKHQLYIGTGWPIPSVNNILVLDTQNDKIMCPIQLERTKYNWNHTQIDDVKIDPANPDILYATSGDGNAFIKIDLNSLKLSDVLVLNEESLRPVFFVRQPMQNTGYVLVHQSAKAFELDLDKAVIKDTVKFPSIRSDAGAYDAAFIDNGKKMLIAQGETFLEIDTVSMRLLAKHSLPPNTPSVWHFILSNDQKTIYSVTYSDGDNADTFLAIDAVNFKVKACLKLKGGGFAFRPYKLPDSSKLYVLGGQQNGSITIHVIEAENYTIQKTITFDEPGLQGISAGPSCPYAYDSNSHTLFLGTTGTVLAINTDNDVIRKVIHLGDAVDDIGINKDYLPLINATGLVYIPKENQLYISLLDALLISIYDLNNDRFLPQIIPLKGFFSTYLFANDDYSKIYSINVRSDSITVIDTRSKEVEKIIDLHE